MVSKHAQQRYKGIAAGTSSGLSIIGSIYILGRYWYARRAKTRAAVHHIDVTKELIHVLAWLDLVGAAGRCVGVLPTQTYDQSKGEPVTSVCQLQAFVITFGDVSPIAWNFLMAYNLYRWVCLGEDQQMLQRRIKWYICGTLVFTLTIDTLALGFNAFGAAGQWCWVAFPGNRAKELYWKLITLYVWVLLGGVAMGVLLVLVKLNVQKRLKGVDNDDARVAYHGVVQNLTIYIVAFIICWCPAVVDRGYLAITGNEIFTLSMLHTSIVPLQGFVNAVIYGKFHVWVGRHLQNTARDTRSSDKSVKSSESLRTTDLQESKRRQFGTANIFVTSFDMNWSPFPQNLNDWVPRDKDLYVFSLQHCVDVQSVEQSIRKHLLQINYPMGYRSITSLAGSMLRGHSHSQDASLCQIVFVNNSDIASGNFQFQTSDGRAWSQRKVFKGVVGIPMRYFEASLAFVSCNLDPISSNAQVPQPVVPLATKHASTLTMVESFEMSADRASVDFPYLYHHTILSGNLGYGVDMPRSKLIATIDQAYKSECLKRATDAALDAKLRAFGRPSLGSARAAATVNSSTLELANTNVPVEWNLLFFKTRGSLGRASCSSNSSNEDQEEYEEVYAADDDGVPFALLQSPARVDARTSFVPVSQSGADSGDETVRLEVAENEHEAAEPPVDSNQAWQRFLNSLFPNDISQGVTPNALTMDVPALVRGDSKKISDWTTKSQLVAQSCKQKWQDLVRHDELRAAIEAKEILCGFEEPPITFLPSFPRQVGAAASYSKLVHKSCKSFFAEASEHLPAYKDRVLLHSLPDTRQRIRNVGYWLCEEVLTSTHKPVCSEFELEVDRFFSYKNAEANVSDIKAGKLALRDKSHIQEYKIKLVNLDANIWTYALRSAPSTSLWRSRGPSPETHTSSVGEQTSVQSIQEEGASSPELRSAGPLSNVLGRMKRKSMHRSPVPDLQSPFVSRGSMSRRGRLESGLTGEQFDLVPVEPTSITTIFPLPSEDVYAMQRKVHEVAHSVQNGFQSSARDEEGEEASLAYTNFRSVSWKEALTRGVMHSAITKAVNGAIHVAIKIEGDVKTQGGQGILCIQERDLIEHAAPVIGEAVPIPFDVPLTWSGKHVGYLHGDILCGL